MFGYSFLTQVDRFNFTSGNCAVLIVGSHAFSNGSKHEKSNHLCDFAVSPMLELINEIAPHKFYMLENMV